MYFATFQPKSVVDTLQAEGEYKVKKYHPLSNSCGVGNESIEYRKGYKPIFVIPLKDKRDFLARMFFEYPSCPQRLIIFKTNKFDTVGFVKWIQLLNYKNSLLRGLNNKRQMSELELDFNYNNIFNEYLVSSISMADVKVIHNISDNEETMRFFDENKTCSDDMLEFLYGAKMDKILNKLFPKDKCKAIDPATVNKATANKLLGYLKLANEDTDSLTDKMMFEMYNFARSNFIRG